MNKNFQLSFVGEWKKGAGIKKPQLSSSFLSWECGHIVSFILDYHTIIIIMEKKRNQLVYMYEILYEKIFRLFSSALCWLDRKSWSKLSCKKEKNTHHKMYLFFHLIWNDNLSACKEIYFFLFVVLFVCLFQLELSHSRRKWWLWSLMF